MSIRFGATLGAVEFAFPNGHRVYLDDKNMSILVYDNNGRAAGHVRVDTERFDATSVARLLVEVSERPKVLPQVRIALR